MATSQSIVDYLVDQLQSARNVRVQKMFGEYALYCDEKVAALVCDDQLFVKITPEGRQYVGERYQEGAAYPAPSRRCASPQTSSMMRNGSAS